MRRIVQRAYKTELDPNALQRQAFLQHAGSVRFIYNWALARKQETYKETGKSPSAFDLNKELTILKRTECPWLYEVCHAALVNAIRQADAAYTNFFRRLKEGKTGRKAGFPRFKSRRRGIGSFKLNGCVHVFERAIQLPVIGTVRLKEAGYLPSVGVRVTSATVSERAGRWYVSIQVEEEMETATSCGPAVGIDLGINRLATLSDGTVIGNPKALRRFQRTLKRAQRALSRKQKGGANRQKARHRVARLHQRVANIRQDTIHKATTAIAKQYGTLVIEDLHVAGMLKNHRLAGAISDASFGEFRRQLAYKADWYGCELIVADRFFPSSKTCSACGAVKEALSLHERVYRCDICGWSGDRDLNAALNLRNVAGKSPETKNAGGGRVRLGLAEQLPMKQEPTSAGCDA